MPLALVGIITFKGGGKFSRYVSCGLLLSGRLAKTVSCGGVKLSVSGVVVACSLLLCEHDNRIIQRAVINSMDLIRIEAKAFFTIDIVAIVFTLI